MEKTLFLYLLPGILIYLVVGVIVAVFFDATTKALSKAIGGPKKPISSKKIRVIIFLWPFVLLGAIK